MPSAWLPVAIVIVVGAAFALLTRRVARRIGRSPNRFGAGDTAHDFVGRVYRVSGAVLFAFLATRIAVPDVDTSLSLTPCSPVRQWPGRVWQS